MKKQANLHAFRMYSGPTCSLPAVHELAGNFAVKPPQGQHAIFDKIACKM